MSYDARRAYGWGQKQSAGTGVSCDTAYMHEHRRVSAAVMRPPLETPAQQAIDRLLREYLERGSPSE